MFSADDTIVAVATPAGRGGVGVVRISGPRALGVASRLTGVESFEPRYATLATVRTGTISDEAIVTWFRQPASYTGEDVVEISAHGSPVLLRAIVQAAVAHGARLAEPGEFTLRAFLHGRIDLVQAEAVRDLIESVTPRQARAAFDQLAGTLTERIAAIDAGLFDLSARLEASLDFPAEGYHFVEAGAVAGEIGALIEKLEQLLREARGGRMIREGATVVVTGRPNVGKSTIFNALAGTSRAIVTATPGTTRDFISEVVDIKGLPVTLVDTAGVRSDAGDPVEREGIERALRAADAADLTVLVLDSSVPQGEEDVLLLERTAARPRLVVANKSDISPAWLHDGHAALRIAARSGVGMDALRQAIVEALGAAETTDAPAVTNLRHAALLEQARDALGRARAAAAQAVPEEFVSADLAEARAALEEITGRRTADDTLNAIFARFCIGK